MDSQAAGFDGHHAAQLATADNSQAESGKTYAHAAILTEKSRSGKFKKNRAGSAEPAKPLRVSVVNIENWEGNYI